MKPKRRRSAYYTLLFLADIHVVLIFLVMTTMPRVSRRNCTTICHPVSAEKWTSTAGGVSDEELHVEDEDDVGLTTPTRQRSVC